MKIAKILGGIVAGLAALIVLLLFAVWWFVNPNNFKPRIVATVKEATGRDLNLQGDIKLSVFPWIALQLGPASLGSPPEFNGAPFLAFVRAEVRVKLLPLLHKELQIDRVELDGLDLKLIKNDAGKGNWELGDETKKPKPKVEGSSGPALQSVAGVKITHGRVSYAPYLLENLDLETGAIGAHRTVPISLSVDANRGVAGERFSLKIKLDAENDSGSGALHVSGLNVSGSVSRPKGGAVNAVLSAAALEANLKQQTLSIPAFALSLDDARLSGKLEGTHIIDDLGLRGTVSLAPLVLKEFAPRFGIALPTTKDPKALTKLSLGSDFVYDAKGVRLDGIQLVLDDTTLKGNIAVAMGKSDAVKFNLHADKIDLDRYRPPPGATPDPKSAAADKPAPKKADGGEPLSAEGVFSMDGVHAAGLDLSKLSVTVDMKDNVTHLHPIEAQLYGGRYSGDLTYDARTATPTLSMDEHLSQVDVAGLMAGTKAKGRVSGKATVNIKGTARGAEADDIMKTLNGHFDANLDDGAIEGLDLGYELALAQSLLAKQTGTSVQNTKRTKFETFRTSAQIADGVAETKDLSIVSAVLKVAGQGTINLPSSALDMALLVSLMKSANATVADIPMKITGTYTNPKARPDLEAVAKGAVKQKLNDVLKKNGLDLNNLFKQH